MQQRRMLSYCRAPTEANSVSPQHELTLPDPTWLGDCRGIGRLH